MGKICEFKSKHAERNRAIEHDSRRRYTELVTEFELNAKLLSQSCADLILAGEDPKKIAGFISSAFLETAATLPLHLEDEENVRTRNKTAFDFCRFFTKFIDELYQCF